MNKSSASTQSNSPQTPSDPNATSSNESRVSVVADDVALADEDLAWIRDRLLEVCAAAKREAAGAQIDVVVIGDEAMARLHRDFLNLPETTDVLTFDLKESKEGPIEGEVYACIDEASRCAAQREHSVREELLLYAVHGLLHLAGYDDHDPVEHERMHRREDELLAAVGVGPVYSAKDLNS
jgi:probable rRNA maturation factor